MPRFVWWLAYVGLLLVLLTNHVHFSVH